MASTRRVVITGMGVVCPLGNSVTDLWHSLQAGRRGFGPWPWGAGNGGPLRLAAMAGDFTGGMEDFGELDEARKKAIRKGLKLMCREVKMGVAAAQRAWSHAGLPGAGHDPERTGVVFGCDHIVTEPEDFSEAFAACEAAHGVLDAGQLARLGMPRVTPLWMLKYLPNMPASHVAIYNDLRGPNNSLTYREASANLALGEAATIIRAGRADRMLAGATGSSVGPLRALHAAFLFPPATGDAASAGCRPFHRDRSGTVAGEGAAVFVLEERQGALARGATLFGEVVACASSVVTNRQGVANIRRAVANAVSAALRQGPLAPQEIGHIHAHGLGTRHADREEAWGLRDALGEATDRIPVVAAKSNWGNLGAAGGLVELAASLLALREGRLFPLPHRHVADPGCPIRLSLAGESEAGRSVLNVSFSPVGQASVALIQCASASR